MCTLPPTVCWSCIMMTPCTPTSRATPEVHTASRIRAPSCTSAQCAPSSRAMSAACASARSTRPSIRNSNRPTASGFPRSMRSSRCSAPSVRRRHGSSWRSRLIRPGRSCQPHRQCWQNAPSPSCARGVAHRMTIIAFDWRAVMAVKRFAPEIPTSYLTFEGKDSTEWNTIEIGRPGAAVWMGGLDVDAHAGSVPRAIAAADRPDVRRQLQAQSKGAPPPP